MREREGGGEKGEKDWERGKEKQGVREGRRETWKPHTTLSLDLLLWVEK